MEFGNPIVGGEDLIRESIKSPNFTDTENGVQGWQIARDGTATFYNLVVGSPNYTIDENGNAVFSSVSADSIILNGTDLQSIIDSIPAGLLAVNTVNFNSSSYNGTEIVIGRLIIPDFKITQEYELGCNFHIDVQTQAQGYVKVNIRYAWDTDPTITSTLLDSFDFQTTGNSASAFDQWINLSYPFHLNSQGGTDLRIAFGLTAATASVTGARLQAEPSNKVWAKHLGPKITYGSFNPGVSTSPPTQYVKTYAANWSASYQSDGSNRNIAECYQGYYSGTNGNQYSLIGLPYAQIQSDLSGATITKTEIYLNNNHFYSNSGGTAYVGTHSYATEPGTASLSNVSERLDSETFTYGQAKWFPVTNTIATNLKNNTAKGIALGPGPSNSQSYYGYFAGNGQSGEPQIRITYTK